MGLKHTPGPWEADTESDHGDYVIWTKEGNFLANLGTGGISFEDHPERETIAFDVAAENAYLIAAAPALRDVVEALILFYDSPHWTPEKAARWEELTGSTEATTKVLADSARVALGMTERKADD